MCTYPDIDDDLNPVQRHCASTRTQPHQASRTGGESGGCKRLRPGAPQQHMVQLPAHAAAVPCQCPGPGGRNQVPQVLDTSAKWHSYSVAQHTAVRGGR